MAERDMLAGMLRMLILNDLSRGPGYGYGIAKAIERSSGGDLQVHPESLYPVLHRLEQEGLLTCKWEAADNGRPRKVYTLTIKGRKRWSSQRQRFIKQTCGALRSMGIEFEGGQA